MNTINDKSEYDKEFKNTNSNKNLRATALTEAINCRKEEADRYWKRSSYFWALSTVAFTGFFALQNSESATKESLLVISCVGFIFSFSGYLACRGANQWLAHWEQHVDMLEDDIIGPLFKTVVTPVGHVLNPLSPFPFSVTRINQILVLYITIVWLILLLQSCISVSSQFLDVDCINKCFDPCFKECISNSLDIFFLVTILLLTFGFTILLFVKGQSSRTLERKVSMTKRFYLLLPKDENN